MKQEKKSRTPNEYIGMSLKELDNQENICNMMLEHSRRELKKKQEEIAELESTIKSYINSLHRIATARTKVGNIEYTPLLRVYKKEESVCIDKSLPYYSSSNYKSFIVYNFDIVNVNKLDFNKVGDCLYNSVSDTNVPIVTQRGIYRPQAGGFEPDRGFKADNKKELQRFIINAIKAFGVKDVVFTEGVNIGKADIEKLIGKPVIIKGRYERF